MPILTQKTRHLQNGRIGLYKRDQNWLTHSLWHFGIQPSNLRCSVWIVWCRRVNKMFVCCFFTYSSVQCALGEYQCIIWFGFHIKWDLYLSNMNWRGIFWTPIVVLLQYQISQVVYMKECMNTHCRISLYHSNRFTVYFDFFCFTWEMFSLYLYYGFCTFMVNRETVINVERYSCQVSVIFFWF
jgi:hypothetical protein